MAHLALTLMFQTTSRILVWVIKHVLHLVITARLATCWLPAMETMLVPNCASIRAVAAMSVGAVTATSHAKVALLPPR